MRNKPRNPWIAGLLSYLSIGLGHIYVGEARRGLTLYFLIGFLVLLIQIPIFLFWPTKWAYLGMNIFAVLLVIGVLIDAVRLAKKKTQHYEMKSYNRWYYYVMYLLVVYGLFMTTSVKLKDHFIMRSITMSSTAMEPTIHKNDLVLVSMVAYLWNEPLKDDVAIFACPYKPSLDCVRRIVAAEGDVLHIQDQTVFVNNQPLELKGHVTSKPDLQTYGPLTIPEGSYFVLSDNLKDEDSRQWGVISAKSVKGKVADIWLSNVKHIYTNDDDS